jgi:hypothetical protein
MKKKPRQNLINGRREASNLISLALRTNICRLAPATFIRDITNRDISF